MSRNFPANKAEAMAQLLPNRTVPSIGHAQTNEADHEAEQQQVSSQQGILKYKRTDENAPSHVRNFNMSDELYSAMEGQRLEACLDTSDQDSTSYDKERTLTFISIPIYQIHTRDPMLFYVDIGAPISCIGNLALKKIVHSAGRSSISMIESDRDYQFGDTIMRSKGIVELILPEPGNIRDIAILTDVVNVDIPDLLGLDV